jgi:hypothetical protein
MKLLIVKRKDSIIQSFWRNLFYLGKWYVVSGVIGRVDGKEIQKL